MFDGTAVSQAELLDINHSFKVSDFRNYTIGAIMSFFMS